MRAAARWWRFALVGAIGIAVQLAVIALMIHSGRVPYQVATAAGVVAAVVHNFLWHWHWTWSDRASGRGPIRSFATFALGNGIVSLIGNALVMAILVGAVHLAAIPANMIAIGVCGIANYWIADGVVFSRSRTRVSSVVLAAAMIIAIEPVVSAADIGTEAAAGWTRYVGAVEARRVAEVGDASRFLAMDFFPNATAERRAVLDGAIVVHEVDAADRSGRTIDVRDASVHHWRGVVFLPRISVARLTASLRAGAPATGPDVLRSAVISRDGDAMRVFLRVQRTRFVTVVYDTEHEVRFAQDGPGRASTTSVAVKIAEVADAGTPQERELRPGEDRGFLWRLNAYWRYEAVPGGVMAECESVSLSRSVPFGLQTVAAPFIRSAARESMERTLEQLRQRATTLSQP